MKHDMEKNRRLLVTKGRLWKITVRHLVVKNGTVSWRRVNKLYKTCRTVATPRWSRRRFSFAHSYDTRSFLVQCRSFNKQILKKIHTFYHLSGTKPIFSRQLNLNFT